MKRLTVITMIAVLVLTTLALPATAAVNDMAWRMLFTPSSEYDGVFASATDRNGNLVIAGEESGLQFVAKYRPGGALVWKKTFGAVGSYTYVTDIAIDRDGFIYVVGSTDGDDYSEVGFIRKYGPKGGHHWTKKFGPDGASTDVAGVAVGPAGGIYVTGSTDGDFKRPEWYWGPFSTYLRKYNQAGKVYWTRQFAKPSAGSDDYYDGETYATDVAVGPGGGVYLLAEEWAWGVDSEGDESSSVVLKKVSPRGGVYWTRKFGREKGLMAYGLAVDRTGSPVIAGATARGSFTTKFSHKGRRRWTRFWSGLGVAAVDVDRDRNIYMVGSDGADYASWGAAGAVYPKAYARKLSPSGEHQWMRTFFNGSALGASTDLSGNLYVFGHAIVKEKDFLVKFKN